MEFLRWYATMLRSLLPEALRARLRGAASGLLVSALPGQRPESARLILRGRGAARDLGTLGGFTRAALPPGSAAATIALPEAGHAVLTRSATLPLAVERDLATAIAFEMDRLTPFDSAEVFVHADIVRRDRAAGTLWLRLAILPRHVVAPVIDALAQAGLTATRVEAAMAGRRIVFPLDARAGRSRRVETAMASLCAVLALACIAIPPIRQQIALASLAARQTALAPRLHEAEALRQRLGAARASAATLDAEQVREGNVLATLAAITTAVPDGSFLTDLSIRHRIATLDGESPNAAGLVAALSADRAFADPAFAAPVTRALNEKADIFSIRVRLRRHGAG